MKTDLLLILLLCVLTVVIPLTCIWGSGGARPQSPSASSSAPAETVAPPPQSSSVPEESAISAPVSAAVVDEPAPGPTFGGAVDTFKVLDQTTGKIATVSAFDYVRGAIAAEMPAEYHAEAMKAQGVAAYTYAVMLATQNRENPPPDLRGADFEADPQNLKVYMTEKEAKAFYGDKFDYYWGRVTEAAEEASKYILLYNDEPVVAAYHAISAGKTEDSGNIWNQSLPYLQAVDSEGDILAAGFKSTAVFSPDELASIIRAAYPSAKFLKDPTQWITAEKHSPSGYVTEADIGGIAVPGATVRTLLGLRSTCFEVSMQDGNVVFTVSGYGHGAGLSQYGADYMARQGSDFKEILAHYYPDTTLALIKNQ